MASLPYACNSALLMNFTTFLGNKYKVQIIMAVLIFGLMILCSIIKPLWHADIAWFESIAGTGTLLFVIFSWVNGIRQEWENNLPKRITAEFRFEGRNVMVCRDALLINEAEARAWGQQIGAQMASVRWLKFEPYYKLEKLRIKRSTITGERHKPYKIIFFLTELPMPDQGNEKHLKQVRWELENGCIEWAPEEKDNGEITVRPGFIAGKRQVI